MQLSQYSAANDSGRCAEQMLSQVLEPLRDAYDYIIIDCGLKQELLTVNALSASDYCIIPVQSHFLASEGIPDVLDMVRSVQKHFNPDLKIAGILLTMYQSRPQLCKSVQQSDLSDAIRFSTSTPDSPPPEAESSFISSSSLSL